MRVAWDEVKNLESRRKHGLSFEEAAELFDEAHSVSEDRFIAIGPVTGGIILVVWTAPDDDSLRIISARWANEHEQALYHSYMDESQ